MNNLLLQLLSSAAGNVVFPLIENMAAAMYPKLIADGESFLAALEGRSPIVKDAASVLAGMLTSSPNVTGAIQGTVTDVAAELEKLMAGAIGKLSAADPTVTGTTVASGSSTSASAAGGSLSSAASSSLAGSVEQIVGGVASSVAGTVSSAVGELSTSLLSKIEGLFSAHQGTVAQAAGTAAAAAVTAPSPSPSESHS